MDWDDFRNLLALSRRGTLSGAAAELGVARTTVGRRVQALEERLGVRLFDRTPEGFVATPAGEDLIAAAERMENDALAAAARVQGRDVALHGELRVTTLDFVHAGFIDLFHSFVLRYPKVELTVGTTTDRLSLRRREADVALRLTDAPPEALVGKRVTRMTFRPYAHRRLVEQVGPGATLAAYPWLGDDRRSPDAWFDAWLQSVAPGAQILLRADGYSTVEAIVRRGVAAYLLPDLIGESDPNLVAIAPDVEPFAMHLWALTLPELRTNTRVRAFLDHVYDWFAEERAP